MKKTVSMRSIYVVALILSLASALLLSGCTSFRVVQTDESPNARKITSQITATAWFSSAQAIARLKALQTDKTQSFGSEAFRQQGATNTVEVLRAVLDILSKAQAVP